MGIMDLLIKNRLDINRELDTAEKRKWFSPCTFCNNDQVKDAVTNHCRGRVLDVGCGDMPLRGLIMSVADQYDTLDVEARTDGVTYIGEAQDMHMIEDSSYDTVLCFAVLEHVAEPFKAVDEIQRILKPGGKAILTVPHLCRIHEAPHDYYRYTYYGVEYMMKRTGLTVETLEQSGGLFTFLGHQFSTVFLGLTWHVPVIKRMAFFLNRWLVVRLSIFLDRFAGSNFASGYLCVASKGKSEASG